MEFAKFVEWGFYFVVSGIAYLLVQVLRGFQKDIAKMSTNVTLLLYRQQNQEKTVEKHDKKILNLDRRITTQENK